MNPRTNLRILAICPASIFRVKGAREALGLTNIKVIKDLFGEHSAVFPLEALEKASLRSLLRSLRGYINGVTEESIELICSQVKTRNVNLVFLEGSNLGLLAKGIKRRHPNVQVVTFFHNVESYFFLDLLLLKKRFRNLAVLLANFLAERSAVKWSDKCIVLNARDARVIKQIYRRDNNHISNFYVPEQIVVGSGFFPPIDLGDFCVFVGSSFYANVDGIRWFSKNVAPFIKINTVVIGRGFELYKDELELNKNVVVIGATDNIAMWYKFAHFVVAPIFMGSGMKTKVAEALQFGKYVIGTSEAFTGYERHLPTIGKICNTSDKFIESINYVLDSNKPVFDEQLVNIYKNHFSYTSYKEKLGTILRN